MSDLEKVLSNLAKVSKEIGKVLEVSTYKRYNDLSGLKIDYSDKDQLFLLDEIRMIVEELEGLDRKIKYINTPISYTGTLYKNSSGRYETENGDYYTSGKSIEVLIYDEMSECKKWVLTRVEHDGKDYYVVGYKGVSLEGLTVRIRE